eukprot:XP_011609136.1 PREDICTED: uncharacterized protein LOC105417393 [Takifugu rubripes]
MLADHKPSANRKGSLQQARMSERKHSTFGHCSHSDSDHSKVIDRRSHKFIGGLRAKLCPKSWLKHSTFGHCSHSDSDHSKVIDRRSHKFIGGLRAKLCPKSWLKHSTFGHCSHSDSDHSKVIDRRSHKFIGGLGAKLCPKSWLRPQKRLDVDGDCSNFPTTPMILTFCPVAPVPLQLITPQQFWSVVHSSHHLGIQMSKHNSVEAVTFLQRTGVIALHSAQSGSPRRLNEGWRAASTLFVASTGLSPIPSPLLLNPQSTPYFLQRIAPSH